MKSEEIEKLLQKQQTTNSVVQISFKTRNSFKGIFIKTSDYKDLSRKNLWRIVSETYIKSFNESQDERLAKIFNGVEFTRLELMP